MGSSCMYSFLLSFDIMFERFSHVVECSTNLFIFQCCITYCMNIHNVFSILLLMGSVIISLHIKVVTDISIIDNAMMNIFTDIHHNSPSTNS